MPAKGGKFKIGDLVKFPDNHLLGGVGANLYIVIRAHEGGFVYVHAANPVHYGNTEAMLYHEDDFVLYSTAPKT